MQNLGNYLVWPSTIICSTQRIECKSVVNKLIASIRPNPFVRWIEPIKDRYTIEEMRNLFTELGMLTSEKQAVVLYDFYTASELVQSLLLKPLEDFQNFYFFLHTDSEHRLLPTIRSRSHIIKSLPPDIKKTSQQEDIQSFSGAQLFGSTKIESGAKTKAIKVVDSVIENLRLQMNSYPQKNSLLLSSALRIRSDILYTAVSPQFAVDQLLILIEEASTIKANDNTK